MVPPSVLAQVILCAILWGAAFPLIKVAYGYWDDLPLTLCLFFAGARFTLAGAGILALCTHPWRRLRSANIRLLIGLTITQTCIQYLFFYLGMSLSSGVLGALLVSSGSFWWVLLGPLILKSPRPTLRDWSALAVCSLGITLAVYAPGAGSGHVVAGTLCFLAATLSGVIGLIIMKPLSTTLDAKTATGASLFLGGLVLLLAGAPQAATFWRALTPGLVGITLALAAISGIAFSVWNRLAHTYPVNLLAGYRFLIPLSGTLQASLFISGEAPGRGLVTGGFLVLGALYAITRPSPSDDSAT